MHWQYRAARTSITIFKFLNSPLNLQLEQKYALVSGSHRGTGLMIANALSREGAQVFFHSIRQGDSISPANAVDNGIAVWGDITTDEGTKQLFSMVAEHTDSVDILINNLGNAAGGNWSNSTMAGWREMFEVNTLSAVRLIQAFSKDMKAGGRVINIGTIGSTRPNKAMPHYYAAKGALANLTVSLAKELGPRGITVNLVSPGLIRTPEVEERFLKIALDRGWGSNFNEAESKIAENFFPNPLNRIATREEIADVVVFIASARASFINGQNIKVDGGALDIV